MKRIRFGYVALAALVTALAIPAAGVSQASATGGRCSRMDASWTSLTSSGVQASATSSHGSTCR